MRRLVMRDGEEEEEEGESGSKAEYTADWIESFPRSQPPPATKRYTTFLLIKTPSYTWVKRDRNVEHGSFYKDLAFQTIVER